MIDNKTDKPASATVGVEMRNILRHAADDSSICHLTIEIWPLPIAFAQGLVEHIAAMACAYLADQGFTDGKLEKFPPDGESRP